MWNKKESLQRGARNLLFSPTHYDQSLPLRSIFRVLFLGIHRYIQFIPSFIRSPLLFFPLQINISVHPYEIHRGKWKIKQETGATMNHHTIHPGEIFNLHPGKLDTKRSAIILSSSMASPVFHPTLGNS